MAIPKTIKNGEDFTVRNSRARRHGKPDGGRRMTRRQPHGVQSARFQKYPPVTDTSHPFPLVFDYTMFAATLQGSPANSLKKLFPTCPSPARVQLCPHAAPPAPDNACPHSLSLRAAFPAPDNACPHPALRATFPRKRGKGKLDSAIIAKTLRGATQKLPGREMSGE